MSGYAEKQYSPSTRPDRDPKRATSCHRSIHVMPLDGPKDLVELLGAEFSVKRVEPTGIIPPNQCVVAIALTLDKENVRRTLMDLTRRCPLALVIIVTSEDRLNLTKLVGLNAHHVVLADRVREELPEIVARLRERDLLEAAADILEAAPLDDLLRRGLLMVFRSTRPIHTVKRLASLIGTKPNRLAESFRGIYERTGWHWPDVLEIVALWQTINMLAVKRTLKEVYEQLGLNDRTMRRVATKHVNCKPSELLQHGDRLEAIIIDFVGTAIAGDGSRKG